MNDGPDGWRPSAPLATLRVRARVLGAARDFFAARGIIEVDTPALAPFGVTDPHIDNPRVELAAVPGTPLFLQSSPEYAMKRLLAAGTGDIYQLGKVYRDGELGRRHQPEFTLAEWYRHGLTLAQMSDEAAAFITALLQAAGMAALPVVERRDYANVWRRHVGIDPLGADAAALRRCAADAGIALSPALDRQLGDDRARWLDLIMSHLVVPSFAPDRLTIVERYPAVQAALARIDPDDPRCAERFEIFFGALELANGYRELTDAGEQQARFAADRRMRAALDQPDMQADPALLAALKHGLPDCCGVAVGFDRVLMRALDCTVLTEVIGFPLATGQPGTTT